MPRAVKGLQRAKELGVLDAGGVSLALSRPEDFFGADFDLSELSERVIGLGPMVRRVPAVVRELQELDWWKWTGGVATEDVAGEVDDGTLSLADESVRSVLRDSIAWADENGAAFVPHPSEDGAQLELTPALRERLALAERRARGEPPPTEYARPGGSQSVLLVKENLESVEFDRARSVDELTRRLRLGAPPGLATGFQLFPYQQEGFEWLASRYDETAGDHGGGGVLLGDDMGLGKTLQVLSFLSWLRAHRRGAGPHLVVAPVGLVTNWMRESQRFFGTTLDAMLEARGALVAERGSAVGRLEAAHLVLTSYEALRRSELIFARVPWDVVVLDEAQKAKNPGTQIARVVRTLSARFRLAMTGTPVGYGVPAPVINGQVNESRQRMAIIDEFSDRLGFAALVLAPKAAGVGLNIAAANHVLHYTREWNPALENQANDRCFRLGQKRPVHVHTFVATSRRGTTVDEVLLDELLTRKRELMRQFVVPMCGFEVTTDDMLAKVA